MCQSEASLWELVLSFYHVGPGVWTQVVRLSSRNLFICWEISPGSLSLMTVKLTWVGEHLHVAVICFSPIAGEAEHLFTCLFKFRFHLSWTVHFISPFTDLVICFLVSFLVLFVYLDINLSNGSCLFIWLTHSFAVQILFNFMWYHLSTADLISEWLKSYSERPCLQQYFPTSLTV